MDQTLRAMSDARTVRTLDRLVLFWVALWIVLGAATGITLWRASELGDTVSSSGTTLTTVGTTLRDLSELPLIPDRPGEIGTEVQESAAEITVRGQEVKRQLRLLGVLLGIAVVGIPVTPIVGLYLPLRVRRQREITRLRESLRARPDDEALDAWLEGRARSTLAYEEVERVTRENDGDRVSVSRALADAELRRLGLRRPAAAGTA